MAAENITKVTYLHDVTSEYFSYLNPQGVSIKERGSFVKNRNLTCKRAGVFLRYDTVQSGWRLLTFRRAVLLPSIPECFSYFHALITSRYSLKSSYFCLGLSSEFFRIDYLVKIVNFSPSGSTLLPRSSPLEIHPASQSVIQSVSQSQSLNERETKFS